MGFSYFASFFFCFLPHLLLAVENNPNIAGIISYHLENYIRSDGAGDDDIETQGILRPFTFDDWNAHEEFYMSILREDAKILERYDAGKGKKA